MNALDGLRENARQRGAENQNLVLIWIFKWGWTYADIIRDLIGVKRKIEYQFLKAGIIEKIDLGPGYKPVFIISKAALMRARELYEEMHNYNNAPFLPYNYSNAQNVPKSLYLHQYMAQKKALEYIEDNDLLSIFSERELYAMDLKWPAMPDFTSNGRAVWHEIELNGKYKESLIFQLQQRNKAAKSGLFEKIYFHCGTRGIAENIKKSLEKDKLPIIERLPSGKFSIIPDNRGWNTQILAWRIILEIIKDNSTIDIEIFDPGELEDL